MEGKIIEQFRILREIGRGGMGVVYLAEDLRLQRKVALKFLKNIHLNQSAYKKILEEARQAARINHPGIVTIYDVVQTKEYQFIVMEYIEGRSLSSFMNTHRVSFQIAFRIAKQLVQIIAFAHSQNLIHGDLKPNNIMITPDGNVKLLDFGLSRVLTSGQEPSRISGTLPYMAPEQITGENVDEQTDIYALGIILYQLFTNRLPFSSANQAALIYSIVHENPPEPHKINKSLPESLSRIVLHCLEKEKRNRYDSCKTLLADLKEVEDETRKSSAEFPRRLIYLNIFILFIIISVLFYLIFEIKTQPPPTLPLEAISLPEPVNLIIKYNLPEEEDVEGQINLLGLTELLKEQLQRIPGFQVNTADQSPSIDLPDYSKLEGKNFLVNFSIKKRSKGFDLICQIRNLRKNEQQTFRYRWSDFNEIYSISKSLIVNFLNFAINRNVRLAEFSGPIRENIKAYYYFSRGLYYYKEAHFGLAKQSFDKALDYNPFFARAKYYRGLTLCSQNQYRRALNDFLDILPEANKNIQPEWELQFDWDKNRFVKKLNSVFVIQEGKTPETSLFYIQNYSKKEITIIDLKNKSYKKIKLPSNTQYRTLGMYYIRGNYFFFLKYPRGNKYAIALFDPREKKWQFSSIFEDYIIKLNNDKFYVYTINNQTVKKIDLFKFTKEVKVELPSHQKLRLNKTSDANVVVAFNDSAIYKINFENLEVEYIHEKLGVPLSEIEKSYFLENYLIYTLYNAKQIYFYDIFKSVITDSIPRIRLNLSKLLLHFPLYPFYVSEQQKVLMVFSPDSLLYIYSLKSPNQFRLIGKADIPLNSEVISTVFHIETKDELYIFDNKKQYLYRIDLRGPEFSVISKKMYDHIRRIDVLTPRYIFAIGQANNRILERESLLEKWKIEAKYDFRTKIKKDRIFIFYNEKEQKLAIYDVLNGTFLGFFEFPEDHISQPFFLNHYAYLFSGNKFKSYDLNSFIQLDPLHLANIYLQLAQCYYKIKDYQSALTYIHKIDEELLLKNLQSTKLETQIWLTQNRYQDAAITLAEMLNFVPADSPLETKLNEILQTSRIYFWKSFLVFDPNVVYLTALDQKYLVVSSWRKRYPIYILNMSDGSIRWHWKSEKQSRLVSVSNHEVLWVEYDFYARKFKYYLFDVDQRKKKLLTETNKYTVRPPNIIRLNNQEFAFFHSDISSNAGEIKIFDKSNSKFRSLFLVAKNISYPLKKGDSLLWIAGDSIYTYVPAIRKLTKKAIPNPTFKFPVRKIVDWEPNWMFVELINRDIYKYQPYKKEWEKLSKARLPSIPGYGYLNKKLDLMLVNDRKFRKILLPFLEEPKDYYLNDQVLYILGSRILVEIKNDHIKNVYPLPFPAETVFAFKHHIYVFSAEGELYNINPNWRPKNLAKLKKDLILSLN